MRLEHFVQQQELFTYCPIDISQNTLNLLTKQLEKSLNQLNVQAVQGDYFQALAKIPTSKAERKVVLYIGNFSFSDRGVFFQELAKYLQGIFSLWDLT